MAASDVTRRIEKATLTAFKALPQPLAACPLPAVVYPPIPGEKDYLITKVTACPLYFPTTVGPCGAPRATLLLQKTLYPRIRAIEDIAVTVQTTPSSLVTSRLETSVIESNQQPNTVPPPVVLLGSVGAYVPQGRFSEFFPPNIPYPCRKRL